MPAIRVSLAGARTCFRVLSVSFLLCLPGWARADNPSAQMLEDFERDPLSYALELKIPETIDCASVFLKDPLYAPHVRKPALTALATVYLGANRASEARFTFLELLAQDPTADLDEPDRLAPAVKQLYYGLQDSLLHATDRTAVPDVKTVAFGDIENNALVKTKYDVDLFCRGLTQVMISDLRAVAPLKIVDRQRLAVLREEIGMSSNEQIVDPKFGVPLGKLTGAQSFIFGQIMVISEKDIRFDLRWVNTATSEILLAESIEGKVGSPKDLLKLQKQLLVEKLAPAIEKFLSGEEGAGEVKEKAKSRLASREDQTSDLEGGAYISYLVKAGEALSAEDRGDSKAALVAWREAESINPRDPYAAGRAGVLEAYNHLADVPEDTVR